MDAQDLGFQQTIREMRNTEKENLTGYYVTANCFCCCLEKKKKQTKSKKGKELHETHVLLTPPLQTDAANRSPLARTPQLEEITKEIQAAHDVTEFALHGYTQGEGVKLGDELLNSKLPLYATRAGMRGSRRDT